jgi:4-aminobutyrate aminotransferase-like enzyme
VVSGLLDFGDMLRTHTVNELAIASAYAILDAANPIEAAAALTAGYHRARPLEAIECEALFPLICLRLGLSVTISAIAAEEDPENAHRQITDAKGWATLERLQAIDWRAAESRFRQACGLPSRSRIGAGAPDVDTDVAADAESKLLKRRGAAIAPSLSLSYREPIAIVRGRGQFLYDRSGRAWLDCVNNVCHVGHCHPKIVAALAEQAAVLNTNTRYLHPLVVEYAERLTATLPEPLRVCFFVNSGSEANDLAVRIARTVTGRNDVIVIDGAYHGITGTLVDLSPYKSEGAGGGGLPPWAHKVPAPDPYRGGPPGNDGARSGNNDAASRAPSAVDEPPGRAAAAPVREICERLARDGKPPALFMCEPILGCGGQVVPPDGYLREAFHHVRAAGGLCLADEVQVGFGRIGTHMWAFEAQGVVPDIVTMGKPIGNGHPIGAVITSAEIARRFDNGMEFFSTFGGNPVSAAVGLAVLDVIESEQLQQRAARVGAYLLERFRSLADQQPAIGDVRGRGLFLGVELVRDRTARTPATEETAELIERVKEDGILLSSDGPHRNVLKIKPPLVFGEVDADLLIASIRRAIEVIFRPCGGQA